MPHEGPECMQKNVKYRNIIEIDTTIIGCDYVGWSILVRETYDAVSEYKK